MIIFFVLFRVELSDWSSWTRRSCYNNFFNTTAFAGPLRTNSTWVMHKYASKPRCSLWLEAVISFKFTHTCPVWIFGTVIYKGCVPFPQVCRSWHSNFKTASLSGRIYHTWVAREDTGRDKPRSPWNPRSGSRSSAKTPSISRMWASSVLKIRRD